MPRGTLRHNRETTAPHVRAGRTDSWCTVEHEQKRGPDQSIFAKQWRYGVSQTAKTVDGACLVVYTRIHHDSRKALVTEKWGDCFFSSMHLSVHALSGSVSAIR